MSRFTADIYQNEFLPVDGAEVHAIVTVACAGGTPSSAEAAEIVIVDTSGSMAVPASRIRAAEEATREAINAIRDDVRFAVIAGDHEAHQLYPRDGGLTMSSDATRRDAEKTVRRI